MESAAIAACNKKPNGLIFYRVEYNGVITALKVLEELPNGDKKMAGSNEALTKITPFEISFVDDWAFCPSIWTQTFNPEKPEYEGKFFTDVALAKAKALENFQKDARPNDLYRIARYFDDVFDGYVRESDGPMSKQKALERLKEYKNNSIYTRFRIVVDGKQY